MRCWRETLASRVYRALKEVCLGQARRVRFRSRSRGIGSLENKRNVTGLRFVLQQTEEGNAGYLLWQGDRLPAPLQLGSSGGALRTASPIKYARLMVRQASSARALGADVGGERYVVQLALEGVPYQKPKHRVGDDTVGLDLGPPTIAIVPREGEARLEVLCAELVPESAAIRRLQRQMERQRRANNVGELRCARTDQEAWQGAPLVEIQPAVSGHPAPQGHPRAETRRSRQKSAWAAGP